MNVNELLIPARVLANANADSRKQALEVLSQLLSKNQTTLTQADIMRSFVARERLGSTAIGNGIALPHGRIAGIKDAIGALIRLNEPVEYGSEENTPVSLMFAMLVPDKTAETYSGLISEVATRLRDGRILPALRTAKTSNALYACFVGDNTGTRHLTEKRRA